MSQTRQITLRMEDEKMQQVAARANSLGCSINEWLNRVVDYAIATKSGEYTVVTKTTYKL